jgi:1-acyl-sn-glycerol-3-phosphate acyltransferase
MFLVSYVRFILLYHRGWLVSKPFNAIGTTLSFATTLLSMLPIIRVFLICHFSVTYDLFRSDLSVSHSHPVPQSLPVNTVCVAKTTLKWVPLFGIFWYASGNVYVDRQRRDSAVQSLDAAAQRLRDGECSLWIFPEGTRNHKDRNHLLPFKKGAFHVAVQSGRPIVPVVASNQSWIYDPGHGHWRGGVILMRALPPIETKNKTIADVDDLIAQTNAVMQKALDEINAEAKQLNGA